MGDPRLPPAACPAPLPPLLRPPLTDGEHALHVVTRRHVVALDQLEHPHRNEAHGGAKGHVPHGEGDGEREAGIGQQPGAGGGVGRGRGR